MRKLLTVIGIGGAGVALTTVIMLVSLFVVPVFYVALAWLVGFFVSLIFGDLLASGLNLIFGADRFISEDIPKLTAAITLLSIPLMYVFGYVGGVKNERS